MREVESNGRHILKVRYRLITILSPTGTQFQEVEPATGAFHKLFLADKPSGRYRGEDAPAISTGKVTRAIGTNNQRSHVLVFVIVVDTTEERGQRPFVKRIALDVGGGVSDGVGYPRMIHIGFHRGQLLPFRHAVDYRKVFARYGLLKRLAYQYIKEVTVPIGKDVRDCILLRNVMSQC